MRIKGKRYPAVERELIELLCNVETIFECQVSTVRLALAPTELQQQLLSVTNTGTKENRTIFHVHVTLALILAPKEPGLSIVVLLT